MLCASCIVCRTSFAKWSNSFFSLIISMFFLSYTSLKTSLFITVVSLFNVGINLIDLARLELVQWGRCLGTCMGWRNRGREDEAREEGWTGRAKQKETRRKGGKGIEEERQDWCKEVATTITTTTAAAVITTTITTAKNER